MTDYIDAEPMYRARLAWDLLPCDEAVNGMVGMGLTPPSGDTAEMEHAHAHDRLEAVELYEPRIQLMSQICTDLVLMSVLGPEDLERLEPEELSALKSSYTQIISICSAAIIGNLMADEVSGLHAMARKGGMKK